MTSLVFPLHPSYGSGALISKFRVKCIAQGPHFPGLAQKIYGAGAPLSKFSVKLYSSGAPLSKFSVKMYGSGAPISKVSVKIYSSGAPLSKFSVKTYGGPPIPSFAKKCIDQGLIFSNLA